jgi:hypothetical protein
MKAMTKTRTPFLATGYLIAFFCLFIGLQALLAQRMDVNLVTSAATLAATATATVFKLTGWTLVLFVPLSLKIGHHGLKAWNAGKLLPGQHAKLTLLAEIAVGVGMVGTLWAFVSTARGYAENAASDPQTTLMTILIGVGSTMAGAVIAIAVQAMLYHFDTHQQSA